MENATKALLIAAGMLLTIFIISTIVVFREQLAGYLSEKHSSTILQQTIEFNNKFQNYDGKTIRGNELLSIMNRIVDYNNYESDVIGYEPVKITIGFLGRQEDFYFDYENTTNKYFKSDITTVGNDDSPIKEITGLSAKLAIDYGLTETQLQLMSSNISTIAAKNEESVKVLKKILKIEVSLADVDSYIDAAYSYYQLTYFKRAMFNCTDVTYDEETGRVNGMNFVVVLNDDDGKIKFE